MSSKILIIKTYTNLSYRRRKELHMKRVCRIENLICQTVDKQKDGQHGELFTTTALYSIIILPKTTSNYLIYNDTECFLFIFIFCYHSLFFIFILLCSSNSYFQMANNLVKGEVLLSGKTLNDNVPLFAEIFEVFFILFVLNLL